MALKKIANEIGFDLPFYTRTGWPELASPVPFGEMLPLYGVMLMVAGNGVLTRPPGVLAGHPFQSLSTWG